MNQFDLDWLLGGVKGGMKLIIFASRYGGELIVALTTNAEHGAAIEDNYSGGDQDYADVSYPLRDLEWFPIVSVDTIDQAIPAMIAKIKQIQDMQLDYVEWSCCVSWVGSFIEADCHRRIIADDLVIRNGLKDLKNAYKILGDKSWEIFHEKKVSEN